MPTTQHNLHITVIIPALDEEKSISQVVTSIPEFVSRTIVVDNGSIDATAQLAKEAGAIVVSEPEKGYGRACLAGIKQAGKTDIIVFMDADAADNPDDMQALIDPIIGDKADLVIGSRLTGTVAQGALTVPQRFGNWLACRLMKLIWNAPYTDLGPFRAIRASLLPSLNLDSLTYGWTVQTQVRAIKAGLRPAEVSVDYRNRIGTSKISGTVRGVILAGGYILSVIFLEALRKDTVTPVANLKNQTQQF